MINEKNLRLYTSCFFEFVNKVKQLHYEADIVK